METLAIVLLLAVTLALLLPIVFFFYISAVLALMVGWSFGRAWGWATFAVTLSLAVYAVAMRGDAFPAVGWILVAAPLVLWRPVVGHGRRRRAAERAALIERMRAQKKDRPRRPARHGRWAAECQKLSVRLRDARMGSASTRKQEP